MDIFGLPKTMNILGMKACFKSVAEMGRQCQEELLVAAEQKKREKVSTKQELLKAMY